MEEQIKLLISISNDLNLIPQTHMVKEENQALQKFLPDYYMHMVT